MKLEFIKEQINWVDNYTSNLINDIDERDLGVVDNLSTSLNWEIGHIIISKYFHSLQSVINENNEIIKKTKQKILTDDLFKYYFAGSNPLANWNERPNKNQLLEIKKVVDMATSHALEELSEKNLTQKTEIRNPVASSKYDALTFTFKHQMWHNGQIAMIKRIIKNKGST